MMVACKIKLCHLIIIPLLLFPLTAMTDSIEKGKVKAKLCEGCHGSNGISVSSIIPNLAGQKMEYLVVSLKAFKNGSRKNGIMSSVVTKTSDDDIYDISSFSSSLNISQQDH